MNVKEIILLCLGVVLAVVIGLLGANISTSLNRLTGFETRNTKLEALNADLESRNRSLAAGLADAEQRARDNADQASELRDNIRTVTSRATKELEGIKRITDRAKRIDALAKLIDKTVGDIIKANNFMEGVDVDSVGDSIR